MGLNINQRNPGNYAFGGVWWGKAIGQKRGGEEFPGQ